jgi:hypothetical protein
MKGKPPLKPFDFLALGIAAAFTVFSAVAVYARSSDAADQVVLRSSGGKVWVYPLDAEETVEVQGPLGDTVVRISGRRAWVASSPCNNQTCVAAGHITAQGQWVACLPNSVFFSIEGTGNAEGDLDSLAW